MDYLTFSAGTFEENEKMAMTAIDIINKTVGYPNSQGTTTCSDVIKHPDGVQVAMNMMPDWIVIADKNDFSALLGSVLVKDQLPDDWYKDIVEKEYIETKFDPAKVDPDIKPDPKEDDK